MTVELGVGDVLHWEGFKFGDGVIRNKFFVVLGAKAGRDCLVVIATSQHKGKSYEAGCHPNEGYYLIPGGSKDFFSEDTWLLLMECRVLSFAEVRNATSGKQLRVKAGLRQDLANAIRNCLKRIEDVSEAQLDLL